MRVVGTGGRYPLRGASTKASTTLPRPAATRPLLFLLLALLLPLLLLPVVMLDRDKDEQAQSAPLHCHLAAFRKRFHSRKALKNRWRCYATLRHAAVLVQARLPTATGRGTCAWRSNVAAGQAT